MRPLPGATAALGGWLASHFADRETATFDHPLYLPRVENLAVPDHEIDALVFDIDLDGVFLYPR